jgi:hypothetical protein
MAAVALLLAVPAARADLDPPNLHINRPGGFAQSGGGTDWVTLPTFNGDFNIQDVSNKSETISPWHLIIAIPQLGLTPPGSILDDITRIGGTTLGTPITNDSETTLLAGQDSYTRLGVPGSGLPNSMSFTNFSAATEALGGITPQSYGLYDFTISATSFAILSGASPLDILLGDGVGGPGLLPTGSVLFAWGTGDDGTTFSTSFTNAGVTSQQSVATPEPSTALVAGIFLAAMVPYFAWRRRRLLALG